MYPLIENCLITRVKNAVAAGQTDQDGTVLDMAGWDGVLFVSLLNTVVDGAVLELQCQGSAANDGSSPAQESTTGAVTAATSSNKVMALDTIRPAHRYVFARQKRGTQNATLDGIIAVQYRGRTQPTVQSLLAAALAVVG